MSKQRRDGFTELEERFAGYTAYDANHEKIGKVDDLFVDEYDKLEYIGVKTGFLGTKFRSYEKKRKTLIEQLDRKIKDAP